MRRLIEKMKSKINKIKLTSVGVIRVLCNAYEYKRQANFYGKSNADFPINIRNNWFIYDDIAKDAGNVDSHYFLQDIYMARKIIENHPQNHFDIGSRIDGFIGHLLCSEVIENVYLIDIRPFPVKVPHLSFVQADATNLDNISDESLESISSLHAIEHFGLGRYGDKIDIDAWRKALLSIQKKIKKGGYFYLSVPVGNVQKVCFNAHRIFSPSTIINTLDELCLVQFAYISDYKVVEVAVSQMSNIESQLGEYDCGLFIFKR